MWIATSGAVKNIYVPFTIAAENLKTRDLSLAIDEVDASISFLADANRCHTRMTFRRRICGCLI